MTWRELECFNEGYAEHWHRLSGLAAWTQTNLINAQIPKGKKRIRVEEILPPRKRKSFSGGEPQTDEAAMADLEAAFQERGSEPKVDALTQDKMRRRAAIERQEEREFWSSSAGASMKAAMADLEVTHESRAGEAGDVERWNH